MMNKINTTNFFSILFILTLIVTFVSNRFQLGWISATVWALSMYGLLVYFSLKKEDKLLQKFILWGTISGFIELSADSWAVRGINALVYYKGGFFIWDSPLYMPFFWAYMLAILAYLSIVLVDKLGMAKSMIIYAFLGVITGPSIEFLANEAKWWYYQNTINIFGTPIYIIGGEIILFTFIPFVANKIRKSPNQTVELGFMYGLFLWYAYAIIYYTFDTGKLF